MINNGLQVFEVKDCTHIPIATGVSAQTLSELRDKLLLIPPQSIYHHFWGRFLASEFKNTEYHNDFAFWAHNALHDEFLAERLSIVDPSEYDSIEELRDDLIDILSKRLDELEYLPMSRRENKFHFVLSKMIIFDTPYQIESPKDLLKTLEVIPITSVFYHVIDARTRTPDRQDDFVQWLKAFDGQYQELIHQLELIDPYFFDMRDLKNKYVSVISNFFSRMGSYET